MVYSETRIVIGCLWFSLCSVLIVMNNFIKGRFGVKTKEVKDSEVKEEPVKVIEVKKIVVKEKRA